MPLGMTEHWGFEVLTSRVLYGSNLMTHGYGSHLAYTQCLMQTPCILVAYAKDTCFPLNLICPLAPDQLMVSCVSLLTPSCSTGL